MKVSLNLAQDFSNVNLRPISHDVLLKRVGAQLGAVEEVIDWAPKYQRIVVAKIITCEDHPNADRLHVCTIDDGGSTKGVKRDAKGYVQVVCGAPNVKAGMLVAWIPPGATVPTTYGTDDPFVLEARELRGVVSNGMLASAKELGLSDDHEGILEITDFEGTSSKEQVASGKTIKPGTSLSDLFGLDDFVIDCENKMFTHRPDCFGNLGVARELAGISGLTFKSPDWYLKEPEWRRTNGEGRGTDIKLTVKNEVSKLVPRFMAVALKNITVSKSPVWLQAVLARVGMKSINNVVDVTNYVMHLTGQPLHAYDADKLRQVASQQVGGSASLETRMSKKGDKLKLLNGKELAFEDSSDIVIVSNDVPVGLAGIMGGSETEVDQNTKNIVIECATFDMYTIRRTSMRYGLFTDASTRYTKGQSPLQNSRVLAYALKMLQELAGAEQASTVYDIHGKLEASADVVVTAQFINERLGSNLSLKDIAKLLENVEFTIKTVPADKNRLHIRPPFWRTDIELPEDIVEEVGRLHGFADLPQVLPTRSAKATPQNAALSYKMHLRYKLQESGANEVLTYSFVHGDLMRKVGQDPDKAFHIRNAISPDLQYYRLSVLPSLLDKVQANIRSDMVRGDDNEFAIFELGKTHMQGFMNEEKVPEEKETLSLVFVADDKTAARKYDGSPYYQARKYLEYILPEGVVFEAIDHDPEHDAAKQTLMPFERNWAAYVKLNSELLGFVGEIRADVKQALKLPNFTAGFEIDISHLVDTGRTIYQPVSQFPKVQQDITLEVAAKTPFTAVEKLLSDELAAALDEHGYSSTLMPRDIFQSESAEQRSDKKRLTYRIWLSHPGRTLTTEETNRLLDKLAVQAQAKLSAERI
jgi:phenylalanyl-tRNA synthetase beta chain